MAEIIVDSGAKNMSCLVEQIVPEGITSIYPPTMHQILGFQVGKPCLLPHIVIILIQNTAALAAMVKVMRPVDALNAATMEPLIRVTAIPSTMANAMEAATLGALVKTMAAPETTEATTLGPFTKSMANPDNSDAVTFWLLILIRRKAMSQDPNSRTIATPAGREIVILVAWISSTLTTSDTVIILIHRQATVMTDFLFPPPKASLLTPSARVQGPRTGNIECTGSRMR